MARICLHDGKDPEIRGMAEKLISDQEGEIGEFKARQADFGRCWHGCRSAAPRSSGFGSATPGSVYFAGLPGGPGLP